MSLMSLCIMLPRILTEINKCPYCNVYIYAVFFCFDEDIHNFRESNCMNKASSVTDSYLQNFFFLVKVDILSLPMIVRKGRLMFVIFCKIV